MEGDRMKREDGERRPERREHRGDRPEPREHRGDRPERREDPWDRRGDRDEPWRGIPFPERREGDRRHDRDERREGDRRDDRRGRPERREDRRDDRRPERPERRDDRGCEDCKEAGDDEKDGIVVEVKAYVKDKDFEGDRMKREDGERRPERREHRGDRPEG